MIRFRIDNERKFTVDNRESLYVGDTLAEFGIVLPSTIDNVLIGELDCEMRVYLDDDNYLPYPIATDGSLEPIPVGADLTDEERDLKVMFIFTRNGVDKGNTNSEIVPVHATLGGSEAPSRSDLEEELENFEQELVNLIQGTTQELDSPSEVTKIGEYAFMNHTDLTSVVINDGCTEIGTYAFRGCTSLASITIPNSVTSIKSYAFDSCTALGSITLPTGLTSIGDYCFQQASLASITIPGSVNIINAYSFASCTNLTSVTLTAGVKKLLSHCFDSCANLTSVNIPNSVILFDAACFRACTSLESLIFSNSVTSIGNYAFAGCSSLANVDLTKFTNPNAIPTLANSNAFSDNASGRKFVVANAEMKAAFSAATNWSTYASDFITAEEAAQNA